MRVKYLAGMLMALSIILGCGGTIQQNENDLVNTTENENISVAVMPFEDLITFPFTSDYVRVAIINSLLFRNCDVIEDPAVWNKVIKSETILYNMQMKGAAKVAKLMDVNWVVYGYANLNSNRDNDLLERLGIVQPIVINVYDSKSNTILLHEKLWAQTNWGLDRSIKTVSQLADEFVQKLVARGYLH